MTAANSVHASLGGTSFPLAPQAAGAPELASLDPARDILLELLAAAINAELEPMWATAVEDTPLDGRDPVETKLPELPDEETLRQVGTRFPLLAVSRAGAPVQVEDDNLEQVKETWRWDVEYFLGALDVGNKGRLKDGLLAVARAIELTLHDGGHRAYAVDAQGFYPKSVLAAGDGCCGFNSLRVVDYQIGAAQLSPDSPKFWACSMTLETTELSRTSAAGLSGGPYQGTSVELKTGNEQGIRTFVAADSALPLP